MARCERPPGPLLVLLVVALTALHAVTSAAEPPYLEVMKLSIKFYEAQMSGAQPSWSSVSTTAGGWKSGSHALDGWSASGQTSQYYPGVNLTGGWYENGGFLKVSLTTGASASLLAYGALTWRQPWQGQWGLIYNQLSWATDYLIKCSYASGKYVAQIGDQYTDDRYWGRPELQPVGGATGSDSWRPVYSINTASGGRGADVVAQAAAAVMGTALVGKAIGLNPSVYQAHANSAIELYTIAKGLEGVYMPPDGNLTTLSRTYRDDQAWAAAWMCRWQVDTQNASLPYCTEALQFWDAMQELRGSQPYLSADTMNLAAAMLLRDTMGLQPTIFPADATYLLQFNAMIENAYTWWTSAEATPCEPCKDTGICKTPGGLIVLHQYGSAHYAANMALVALSAAKPSPAAPGTPVDSAKHERICWARRQIGYLLGNNTNNQAFVVGLKQAPGVSASIRTPTRPRHRASACHMATGACVGPEENNPHTLVGALVGGPNWSDDFTDSRNSVNSLVSIEYNAGFTAALTALSAVEQELLGVGFTLEAYCTGDASVTYASVAQASVPAFTATACFFRAQY